MKLNRVGPVTGRDILLLQGPMGDFFQRLEKYFLRKGARVHRIGFNAGDEYYSNPSFYTPYMGTKEHWEDFIRVYLKQNNIKKIFLFGDCRSYQSIAISVARELGVCVFVFEEGYVRPDYITLERNGVNGFSLLPKERGFYEGLNLEHYSFNPPEKTNNKASKRIWSAMFYYFIGNLLSHKYPYYNHHRDFSVSREAFYGVRGLVRKFKNKVLERNLEESLIKPLAGKYFLVPLQTHNDFQLVQHSDFESIEHFIETVLYSYKESGVEEHLIFKHHPVDRGRRDYKKLIMSLASAIGIKDKISIVYDVHLPTCLKNAKGTVVINSTVGLSSLYHGTATINLGVAVYDIEGISHRSGLDTFWKHPEKPDAKLFKNFYNYLIYTTQVNASFYGSTPELDMNEDLGGSQGFTHAALFDESR